MLLRLPRFGSAAVAARVLAHMLSMRSSACRCASACPPRRREAAQVWRSVAHDFAAAATCGSNGQLQVQAQARAHSPSHALSASTDTAMLRLAKRALEACVLAGQPGAAAAEHPRVGQSRRGWQREGERERRGSAPAPAAAQGREGGDGRRGRETALSRSLRQAHRGAVHVVGPGRAAAGERRRGTSPLERWQQQQRRGASSARGLLGERMATSEPYYPLLQVSAHSATRKGVCVGSQGS